MAGFLLFTISCLGIINVVNAVKIGTAEKVYSWPILEFDWDSPEQLQKFNDSGEYIQENCPFTGIKVYKGKTYINVPRWRLGIPSTLNVVVEKNGKNLLKPFPDWDSQKVGNCDALQFVQSMEIDPNTGMMWIIDTGRINIFPVSGSPQNLCPPKILIYDINKEQFVDKYEFPSSVVNSTTTFLNDIVIDYVNGKARYAYITDTFDFKLVVYDAKERTSYFFQDLPSMAPEEGNVGDITVSGVTVSVGVLGINGIAMSPSFDYVYYGPVAGFGLHQVPTYLLRSKHSNITGQVRNIGAKVSQSDGMLFTQSNNLYFPVLTKNALYKWDMGSDMVSQGVPEGMVTLETEEEVVRNDSTMQWIDTLGVDTDGYVWFTAPAVHRWMTGNMDLTGKSGDNFYIWKVYMNEKGYLQDADFRTGGKPNGGNSVHNNSIYRFFLKCIYAFLSQVMYK